MNCLWSGRLAIDAQMGARPTRPWVYRLKYRVFADLPSDLASRLPSLTIVLGRYGDIVTRAGERSAYLSWYPACLRGWETGLGMPDAWRGPTDGNVDPDVAAVVARDTLDAFDAIVPGIGGAAPTDVRAGVIVSWGATDIDDPGSELHERKDIGVQGGDGYYSIDTGKLTCAPLFASRLVERSSRRPPGRPNASETIEPSFPLVSIGIPLYRSRRFVDRITRNIEAIAYPNVEVIVSDRHSDDDAAWQVAARFAREPRVRTVRAADRLTWVEHYNRLLEDASGEYFMWMPHDDEFPAGYVPALVGALEAHPEAVLALGRIERVDLDGRPLDDRRERQPRASRLPGPWSPRLAPRLLVGRETEEPFRGVFRREAVVRARLSIRPTPGNVAADTYWVFAMALLGPFCFVDGCFCRKTYYPASTHAQWDPIRLGQILEGRRILRAYVADLVSDPRDARACTRGIDLWTALGTAGVVARHCGIPAGLRRSAERALSRRLA